MADDGAVASCAFARLAAPTKCASPALSSRLFRAGPGGRRSFGPVGIYVRRMPTCRPQPSTATNTALKLLEQDSDAVVALRTLRRMLAEAHHRLSSEHFYPRYQEEYAW